MATEVMTDRNLSRRERKKIETRQRLLESAFRLFRECGYDTTTVEQIAEAADVAKSTFFNYFGTKETILPALAEWRLQQLNEALLPEQGAPASPVARIKLALRLVADDPLADPVLARRLFAVGGHRLGLKPVHALTDLLAKQVCQAQAVGEIRADLSPVYLGSVIRALFFQQLMMWHHGQRSVPLPELLDGTVDLLLDGIAGPEWRHSS
jgi:AcrR family transcriptional regulator